MRSSFGRRGQSSRPVQFVIGGGSYEELAAWRDVMLERVGDHPGFIGMQADLEEKTPQLRVEIDRTRASDLGVSVETIGQTLSTMLGSRRVTTYQDRGEEYDVILQVRREDRQQPNDLTNIYVRSERTGELIPLTNLVHLTDRAGAADLRRFKPHAVGNAERGAGARFPAGRGARLLRGDSTRRVARVCIYRLSRGITHLPGFRCRCLFHFWLGPVHRVSCLVCPVRKLHSPPRHYADGTHRRCWCVVGALSVRKFTEYL